MPQLAALASLLSLLSSTLAQIPVNQLATVASTAPVLTSVPASMVEGTYVTVQGVNLTTADAAFLYPATPGASGRRIAVSGSTGTSDTIYVPSNNLPVGSYAFSIGNGGGNSNSIPVTLYAPGTTLPTAPTSTPPTPTPSSTPPKTVAPVISSFSASPATITQGQSATLSWSVTGATGISISGVTGAAAATGSQSVTPSQTTTYILTATNSGGSVTAQATVTVTPKASTTESIVFVTPTPNQNVPVGGIVSASLQVTGFVPASMSIATDNGHLYRASQSGSIWTVVIPLSNAQLSQGSHLITAQATDPAGVVVSASVTILVGTVTVSPPVISSFSASPATITQGQSATLSWNVTGATGISISGVTGAATATGSQSVTPAQTTTYILTATNSGGSVTAQATVTLNPANPIAPSIVSFSANPSSITLGSSTTLSWQVTGATSLSINNGVGVVTGNTISVSPQATTTYTLTAANSVGSVTAQTTVIVTPTILPPPPVLPTLNNQQWAFLTLINNFRAQNGVGPLQVDFVLQNSSQWMAGDMAKDGLVSHTDSIGRTFPIRIAAFGYTNFTTAGENLTGGYLPDAVTAFVSLENACDPDANNNCTYAHRANMLNANYKVMGIGVATSSFGSFWATDFGSTADQLIGESSATAAPVITSFAASASTASVGQSFTLSWNVTGATALDLNNGAADVTGLTSQSFTLSTTTIYTLTAINNAGLTTANVTVKLGTAPDTQPPTAPTNLTATAKSQTEVDLSWSPSTDNVSVSGYQVYRNGSFLVLVLGSTAYADTSVVASTTYSYQVKAYDAAANISAGSNSASATTPANVVVVPPSTKFTTGERVQSTASLNVRATPSTSGTLAGTEASRTLGTVTGGPTNANGYNWWSVNYDNGISGWSVEDYLQQYTEPVTPPAPTSTPPVSGSGTIPTYALPTISSFTASPATANSSQGTLLNWSVSGAAIISIDQGVGDVTDIPGIGKAVYPTKTTTYTLTATSPAGSVTAQTTVTVNPCVTGVICNFTATPSEITPGQSVTLTWTGSPTTPVLISPAVNQAGLNNMTGLNSVVVAPTYDTTYSLQTTASNSQITSVFANVLVDGAPNDDTTPPVPPSPAVFTISPAQVTLSWNAVTDTYAPHQVRTSGIANYRVVRNGTVIATLSPTTLYYIDTNVTPGTTYNYVVLSVDTSGNTPMFPSTLQVTIPSVSTSTPKMDIEEYSFLTSINNFRVQNGLPPFQVSLALENAGQWMANDIVTHNSEASTDSLGRSTAARLAAFGYPYTPWGEYLPISTDAGGTGVGLYNQWITTCIPIPTGGCTYGFLNLMKTKTFTVVGIARAYNATTQQWDWVVDLGAVTDPTIAFGPGIIPSPSISYFAASPSTLFTGATTTLGWNETGANSTTIDHGIGDVTNAGTNPGNKSVSPSQTTTYTLTATNPGGSTIATSTVVVNSLTTPPTAPTNLTATAISPSEIDLSWGASTASNGLQEYILSRNGSILATVQNNILNYVDLSVAPSTVYDYVIQAVDNLGNHSASSSLAQAMTPASVTVPTTCVPSSGTFTACYYSGITLSGNPVLINLANPLNYYWVSAFPPSPVPPNGFSARYQGNFNFTAGTHAFSVIASDGVRIYIDGVKVLDEWKDGSLSAYNFSQTMTQGSHLVTVEFYSHTGTPAIHVAWQ